MHWMMLVERASVMTKTIDRYRSNNRDGLIVMTAVYRNNIFEVNQSKFWKKKRCLIGMLSSKSSTLWD